LDNVENNATFMVELELLLTAGVLNSRWREHTTQNLTKTQKKRFGSEG
jgi:hypothetical protein